MHAYKHPNKADEEIFAKCFLQEYSFVEIQLQGNDYDQASCDAKLRRSLCKGFPQQYYLRPFSNISSFFLLKLMQK